MGLLRAAADAISNAAYDLRYSGVIYAATSWHCNQCRDGELSSDPYRGAHEHNGQVHGGKLSVKRDPQFNG
jgi:hypothetical protein